jgi:type IV secretion system protein VirB2
MPRSSRRPVRLLLLVLLLAAQAAPALAGTAGADMPWNQPLQKILDNLTGPTGQTVAALMIVIGGLVWGFGRHEQGMNKIGGAIVAIGLVLGAPSFIGTLGFQGAILSGPRPAAVSSGR